MINNCLFIITSRDTVYIFTIYTFLTLVQAALMVSLFPMVAMLVKTLMNVRLQLTLPRSPFVPSMDHAITLMAVTNVSAMLVSR